MTAETETSKPKSGKPKRKYKRRRAKLSYGPRGLETLMQTFQIGGMTPQEHSRFFETPLKNSYRTLSSLVDQRLLESAPVQTSGRPRGFHFLSKANGSRGIVLGGHEAGLGERRAKEQYRLHQLPQHAEHSHAINEFYLSLLEASRAKNSPAEVSLWNLWGESHPSFPLRGTKRGEKIYPDGLFEVRFDSGLPYRCLLEYESRARRGEALGKLDRYGAHFHRLLKEEPNSVEEWLRPVLFLYGTNETTVNVTRVLIGAVIAGAPELARYRRWRAAAAERGIHAGRFVLLGSMEDTGRRGALGTKFGALEKYPAGAAVAGLREVSCEVSDSVERAGGKRT